MKLEIKRKSHERSEEFTQIAKCDTRNNRYFVANLLKYTTRAIEAGNKAIKYVEVATNCCKSWKVFHLLKN